MRAFISEADRSRAELAEFFWAVGVPVYLGYGLTRLLRGERDSPNANKVGSVGKPDSPCGVRIAETVRFRARPCVMQGYYEKPEETRAIISQMDGSRPRYRTAGCDGYLYVKDRKKDLFKTAAGKNFVAPQPIENLLKASPLILNAVLVGDRRKFIRPAHMQMSATLCRMVDDRGAVLRGGTGGQRASLTGRDLARNSTFAKLGAIKSQSNEFFAGRQPGRIPGSRARPSVDFDQAVARQIFPLPSLNNPLAVRDVQVAVRISRPISPSSSHPTREIISYVLPASRIALHHARAVHENLTVSRNATSTWESVSRRFPTLFAFGNSRSHRRSLGQPISLIDRHAHGPEEFGEFARERSARR